MQNADDFFNNLDAQRNRPEHERRREIEGDWTPEQPPAATPPAGDLWPPQKRCACDCHLPLAETQRKLDTSWHDGFIAQLSQFANVTFAATSVRVRRSTVYEHKEAFPEFSKRWDEAIEEANDYLEMEARKRAIRGSDILMMFLLNAERPEKFKRPTEHRVTTRAEITVTTGEAAAQATNLLADFRAQQRALAEQQQAPRIIDVNRPPERAAAPIDDDDEMPWDVPE